MAQRLLLVALCAVIAVQLISSVEGASKGCIKRCNTGCRKRNKNVMDCLRICYRTYPKSCQKCKKNDDRCYGCLPGFMLSNAKCIPCATGCICDQTSTCLDCRSGYVKTPNGCAVCNPGCDCDSTGKCTCKIGYVASVSYDPTKPTTSGPQCLACPPNCADCSSTGPNECVTCKGGYRLTADGVCQACITGCLDCTSGLTTCDQCKPGYHATVGPTATTCTACPVNCATCDILNTTYCDSCIEGYGLTRNRKGCIACAPNCKRCDWNGYNSCDSPQCLSGFGYDSTSGTCSITCSGDCETCDSTSNCLKCNAGFTLASGQCLSNSTGCSSNVANCVRCSSATTCVECVSGFAAMTTGACQACTDSSCLACTLDGTNTETVCTRCAEGFIPKTVAGASGCWQCKVGCKDCTPTNVDQTTGYCKNCFEPGVTPSATDGSCASSSAAGATPCDTNCAPPYCAVSGNGKCDLNCVAGYVLVGTACTQCTPANNCKHCSTTGIAKCDGPQCKDGYILTPDNKCSKV